MNPEVLSIIGVFVALAFLIGFALLGHNISILAIVAGIIVMLFSGMPIIESLKEVFMVGFGNFAKGNFLMILMGAMFGAFMTVSGAAQSVAFALVRLLRKIPGDKKFNAVIALVLVMAVLTYSGVATGVVVFTVIAIGRSLLEELDVPWSMFTCSALGSGTFAIAMLPGSPAFHNIIPIEYLGTTPMAAPVIGILSTFLCLALGLGYIWLEVKRAEKHGEGFMPSGEEMARSGVSATEDPHHNIILCILPSLSLILSMNLLKLNPIAASLVGCLSICIFFGKDMLVNFKKGIADGTSTGIITAVNVGLIVGFGSVVAAAPGYALVLKALNNVGGPPLLQVVIAVSSIAGITGVATGGMSIALDSMSEQWLAMGINPAILHRIAAMSSISFDTLPHNAAVVTMLTISHLSYRQAYKHVFVTSVAIPLICALFGVFLATLGLV